MLRWAITLARTLIYVMLLLSFLAPRLHRQQIMEMVETVTAVLSFLSSTTFDKILGFKKQLTLAHDILPTLMPGIQHGLPQ